MLGKILIFLFFSPFVLMWWALKLAWWIIKWILIICGLWWLFD